MSNKLMLATLMTAATLATGCKSDTEKVCAKFQDLFGDEIDQMPEKMRKEIEDTQTCVTKLEERKKENPEEFKAFSECLLASDDPKAVFECSKKAKEASE